MTEPILNRLTPGLLNVETGDGPNAGLVAVTMPGTADALILPWNDAMRFAMYLLTAAVSSAHDVGADPNVINRRLTEVMAEMLDAQ